MKQFRGSQDYVRHDSVSEKKNQLIIISLISNIQLYSSFILVEVGLSSWKYLTT